MSAITDILDRLSGVAVVREKLGETARRVDQLADRTRGSLRRGGKGTEPDGACEIEAPDEENGIMRNMWIGL